MAHTKDDIKNKYPLPVHSFEVQFSGLGDVLQFQEVNFGDVEYKYIIYRTGYGDHKYINGHQYEPYDVTMRRGVFKKKDSLLSWIGGSRQIGMKVSTKTITISMTWEGSPIATWVLGDAFCTKMETSDLSANGEEVIIETMDFLGTSLGRK